MGVDGPRRIREVLAVFEYILASIIRGLLAGCAWDDDVSNSENKQAMIHTTVRDICFRVLDGGDIESYVS
jgi:hypothetical protein